MRRAAKVDGNQGEIIAALRQRGYLVRKNTTGDGAEDLTVSRPTWGFAVLLEVKRAKGRLTPKQIAAIGVGWPVHTVRSADEALEILEAVR